MISIIAIVILVVLAFILLRFEHMGRKVKVVLIVIIGAMLYFSVVGLFSSEEIDLTSPRGIIRAIYVYFGWLGEAAGNLWNVGKDTVVGVGNAIKMNSTG